MPRCIICDTSFYHQTWDSPAEPCDCGSCFTRADWQEEGGDEQRARLTKRWERMERIDAYLTKRARRVQEMTK